jgi:hypothetical protein
MAKYKDGSNMYNRWWLASHFVYEVKESEEFANMHLIFGEKRENSAQAEQLHIAKIPNCRSPCSRFKHQLWTTIHALMCSFPYKIGAFSSPFNLCNACALKTPKARTTKRRHTGTRHNGDTKLCQQLLAVLNGNPVSSHTNVQRRWLSPNHFLRILS